MSKIGKEPIKVPENVEVDFSGGKIKVKGPKGKLEKQYPSSKIKLKKEDSVLTVTPIQKDKASQALWGTWRSTIASMVKGVTKGYKKELELEGIGYRAQLEKGNLVLNLGYSHPVTIKPPPGIKFKTEKKKIIVEGTDKQQVGNTAAFIRSKRPPEPYKGKGIRFKEEQIRRKEGKKAVGLEE